jgi:hypothetical protein
MMVVCEMINTLRSKTKAFCFLSWKEKKTTIPIVLTPRRLRGWIVDNNMIFCEAEQTLFASFSGKRRKLLDQLSSRSVGFAAELCTTIWSSAKQNRRFLLLFLEKEEKSDTSSVNPQSKLAVR